MTPQKQAGKILARHIESAGFNQSTFGSFIKIEPRQVRRWIAGDSRIPGSVIMLLRAILKFEINPRDLE